MKNRSVRQNAVDLPGFLLFFVENARKSHFRPLKVKLGHIWSVLKIFFNF
jgi:hypothetical protein